MPVSLLNSWRTEPANPTVRLKGRSAIDPERPFSFGPESALDLGEYYLTMIRTCILRRYNYRYLAVASPTILFLSTNLRRAMRVCKGGVTQFRRNDSWLNRQAQ